MQKLTVLMVGTGGYGGFYLRELLHNPRAEQFQITGAVDPYAGQSECGRELMERGIPIYETVEAFYQEQTAELAVIATPIYLHAHQAIYCMEQGSDVLCEKPICASMEDAEAMIAARDRTGRKLAIGFQWSFSQGILKLKQDIRNGLYGNIRQIRCSMASGLLGGILLAIPGIPYLTFAALGLIGFSFASFYPAMMHAAPERFDDATACTVIGYQGGAGMLGTALIPAVFGYAASRSSFQLLPCLIISFTFLIFLLQMRLDGWGRRDAA